MRLVIVESPAKCQKIQSFLGFGNRVIASMGHIRGLVQDIDSVGIEKNFEPTYEFMKDKAKAIAQLRAAAKDADTIVLCSDDDREGEAIAYSIAILLKLNPLTNPRAAFREITKNAVLEAVNNPRTIDMNRVHSQQARAMLDMMIGFTISPLLWKHVAPALSAGRCQTPALRLVCEREAKIDSFESQSSWNLSGSWTAINDVKKGLKLEWPAKMIEPLDDEESAVNYLENHHSEPNAIIRDAHTKPWTESPPQALMTSTLQQQASNLYHSAPKRTMQMAQKLYEAGHITYMRTDQTIMSQEAIEQASKIVIGNWGKQYLQKPITPTLKKEVTQKEKPKPSNQAETNAQEAHEAIRPTHFEYSQLPQSEDWGVQERKLYHLIWLRAIQSIMASAKGNTRTIIFDADGDDGEFPWQAKWKQVTFPGWKAADEKDTSIKEALHGDDEKEKEKEKEEPEVAEDAWNNAESLRIGQRLEWTRLKAEPKETKPQGRYTEATLVRDLEKKGIGRPSTFASLIDTIVNKSYVEIKDIPAQTQESKTYSLSSINQWPPITSAFLLKRGGEKSRILPSALGTTLLQFAIKNFPDLFAFEFTALMESRLDKVAEGSETWKLVLEDTWNSYKDRLSLLKKGDSINGITNSNPRRKEFRDGLVAVITAKGPLILKEGNTKEETVFYGWPLKQDFAKLTEEEAMTFVLNITQQKEGQSIGEYNGSTVTIKKGPYGNYAECNGIRVNVSQGEGIEEIKIKLQAKHDNPTRALGPFQIRTGQYGPYLMKTGSGSTKSKPQCVSIPKEYDLDTLTAQQAGEIYEAGLKAKATSSKGGYKWKKSDKN